MQLNKAKLHSMALIVIGMSLTDCWWLSLYNSSAQWLPLSSSFGWLNTAIFHSIYFVVFLACGLKPILTEKLFSLPVLPKLIALSVCLSMVPLLLGAYLDEGSIMRFIGLFLAAVTCSFLFLYWMLKYSLLSAQDNITLSVFLMLLAFGLGVWMWALIQLFPRAIMPSLVLCVALGAVFALRLGALRGKSFGSKSGTKAEGLKAGRSEQPRLLALLPLFSLFGIFLYKAAMGFSVGLGFSFDFDEGISLSQAAYFIYASFAVLFAVLIFLLRKKKTAVSMIERIVIPLIVFASLLLSSFVSSGNDFGLDAYSVLPLASMLLASMLFHCFMLAYFARVSGSSSRDAIRVFGLGGAVGQAGLIAGYLLTSSAIDFSTGQMFLVVSAFILLAFLERNFSGGRSLFAGVRPETSLSSEKEVLAPDANVKVDSLKEAVPQAVQEAVHLISASFAKSFCYTQRELDVFELILQGKSAKVIAEQLFIADSTVKTHVKNIYRKTDVSNKQDLIALYEKYQNDYNEIG